MDPKNQKIYFKENLKYLRERKKLSQDSIATLLGYSRAKIAALESGHTKAPQPADYITLSAYFKISIDSLLKVNLCHLTELQLRELEAGNDVYTMGSKIRVLAISVDKENRENAEFIPIKAKAGYRSGYNNPEYIGSLPKFNIPVLPRNGTFRTFPISGASMLLPANSFITGKFMENWKEMKPETPCILILKGEADFVYKMVTLTADGTFVLRSLNKEFQTYTLALDEVLEVWQFYMFHTTSFHQPVTDLDEMKDMLLQLLQKNK